MSKVKPIFVARSLVSKLKLNSPPIPVEKVARLINAVIIEGSLEKDGYTFRRKDIEKIIFLSERPDSFAAQMLRKANEKGLKDEYLYFIFINNQVPLVRKRFTIAHEIGHIVLKHFERSEFIYVFHKEDCQNYFEEEANLFAGELLVPYGFLKQAIFHYNIRDIHSLAKFFNVSEQVVSIKVRQYNLFDYIVKSKSAIFSSQV
ncbi:MAG: ImmA/IrrE family metallo-endopeptidase [Nanopusillaceae archaeon]